MPLAEYGTPQSNVESFMMSRFMAKTDQDSLLDAFHVVTTASVFVFLAAMILFI